MKNDPFALVGPSHALRLARLTWRLARRQAPTEPGGLFISYRREESGHAGRVYDWLQRSFRKDRLFMDVDAIQPGADFVDRIGEALQSAEALVAIIGPRWLAAAERLDNPQDVVRREIAAGLERNILVLPVLVGGARMPSANELPAELADLARRNALTVSDLRWDEGLDQLTKVLGKATGADLNAEPGTESTEQVMARMLLAVADFAQDPDLERDSGDFLIVGAGAGKPDQEEPDFALEVMVSDNKIWCELASNVWTKDEVAITNQMLRLQELGWTHPAAGPLMRHWRRGARLTRWWRDVQIGEGAEELADLSEAIVATFIKVREVFPQGVAAGWVSPPRRHPAAPPDDAGPSEGGWLIRARSPAWQ